MFIEFSVKNEIFEFNPKNLVSMKMLFIQYYYQTRQYWGGSNYAEGFQSYWGGGGGRRGEEEAGNY